MDPRGRPQQLPYRYIGVNARQSSKAWTALGLLFAHHPAYIIKLLDKISNSLLIHANMNCCLYPRGREKPGGLCSAEGQISDPLETGHFVYVYVSHQSSSSSLRKTSGSQETGRSCSESLGTTTLLSSGSMVTLSIASVFTPSAPSERGRPANPQRDTRPPRQVGHALLCYATVWYVPSQLHSSGYFTHP